ncbi:hypothetical protein [Mesorhizobium sp. 2RAF21]|jgi:hypothetical protein|uniref:hypothetical protein n=1 Tax=Mesorhizobium sp. 2RAF21 TaxID=3232995 RepID=UPI003F9CB625
MIPILTRDLLMNMLLGLTALVVLVLAQINPAAKSNEETKPPGNIAVMISWPVGPIDVDLWVTGPGEPVAVGYSNKQGKLWSLLRDDMGTTGDVSPINMENAFARATPAGEYVVNVHGYSLPTGPVPVYVEASLNGRLLVKTNIDLQPKQERTVIRFRLDGEGRLIEGSENRVFKPLREVGK